jgi:hypothetical protein
VIVTRLISVCVDPGVIALTRTPCGPTSLASDRVSPIRPAFEVT